MKSYSQNKEDLIILDYFNSIGIKDGVLLELGANNGIDLSNSKLLIDNGWSGVLVEPSSIFKDLNKLYLSNMNVQCFKVAIGSKDGKMKFYESGAHVPNGKDKALVSTLDAKEMKRWDKVRFTEYDVDVVSFKTFLSNFTTPKFDFISVDCEGFDKIILKQIDLTALNCKCLIIEHNGDLNLIKFYTSYCAKHWLKEIHRNAENILFALI